MIGKCRHANSAAWASSQARKILQPVTDHVRSKPHEVLFRRC